ncbi:5-hydroxyisourate hydrolase [Chitinophaga sp. CF118]|uniref:hydroxyisourate hydrolase n=1 Tax=Chitinophaga sp. CF118 TaxID=1884367 RepID=UPI0008F04CFF|nr:hydroxyisourate hydrolase [Chitinophaga sp. CF118]SFD60864.1 5-hydroxyisourate hydrolase [Chitinophaga sp. CF118]
MSQITTHILDIARGIPAQGVPVILYRQHDDYWDVVAANTTNKEGRIKEFPDQNGKLEPGNYKLKFETKEYFERNDTTSFFPFVEVVFTVSEGKHYHVPLLLSPFGYSTYRGS